MNNTGDVQKLMSSIIRKKRFNRNRRHPSMCVDAVLTSTINLLKNDELVSRILLSKNLKRPSNISTSRPKRKRSRWDMKTREPRTNELDEEMDELTGMETFFQKLKGVSCGQKCVSDKNGDMSTSARCIEKETQSSSINEESVR